jgi:hypothetical protein
MLKCPVEVGDIFWRSTSQINIPDRLEVLDIMEHDGRILVRAKYMYHAIGPIFERTFDAKIFDDPNWIIKKREEKTK